MGELSLFWNGVSVGDAIAAPYDAPTDFAQLMLSVSGSSHYANVGGVFSSQSKLTVTGSTSPLAVAMGQGLVWGTWYDNNATITVPVPTPVAATRIDRIVLRKSWSAQTVRLTRIAGVEGGGAPALVQISGTTWDVPLYQCSITTGGAITLTDQRQWLPASASFTYGTANLGADVAMTNANQYYDGPSLTLGEGTWMVTAQVTLKNTSAAATGFTAKLWDGATVECSGEDTAYPNTSYRHMSLTGVFIVAGTTTVKISVAASQTGASILKAAADNGAGDNASNIRAVRVGV